MWPLLFMAVMGLHYELNRLLLGWLRSHFYNCYDTISKEKTRFIIRDKIYIFFLEHFKWYTQNTL